MSPISVLFPSLISAKLLRPGMPAGVMVITDRRTLMGYLFAPLSKSLDRAFRES